MAAKIKGRFWLIILVVVVLWMGFGKIIPFYTDWLWYEEVGFINIFIKIFQTQVILALIAGIIFFIILFINLRIAVHSEHIYIEESNIFYELDERLKIPTRESVEPFLRKFLLPATLVFGLFSGMGSGNQWDTYLRYINETPFKIQDPIFNNDIGFYIFSLPFLNYIYSFISSILWLSLIGTAVVYFFYRGISITARGVRFSKKAKIHLSILGMLISLLKAYGYRLDMYDLLYSPRGVAYGASYTDIHANLPILKILVILAFVCAFLFVLNIFISTWKPLAGIIILIILVGIVGGSIYPSLLQRFQVVPNEIAMETPYIDYNVKYTRIGYGLDKIQEQEFPAEENLTLDDIKRNDLTVKNIRLWDHRPLLATYAQLQEIRTYYKFIDVDVDRYTINGEYRQIMLSPRELSHKDLPSRIWINEHLTYTHGYGVVFSPVNRISKEGLPEFMIKDIPPQSTVNLKITKPEIYYGEVSNDYAIVNTRSLEFDYPAGDKNVYSKYSGTGGIKMSSFFKKAMFAIRFGTMKILLSDDITPDSRIMYYRAIRERTQKIMPFLQYDRDAYLVISKEGRLYWFIDAYTTSDYFPYSQPTRDVGNYIRNAVKVVIDAFDGKTEFYIADTNDPIVNAYSKIFPGSFKKLDDMPKDLSEHIRYPEDLFSIQAKMYRTYHMQNAQVFYNKEDLWSIPMRRATDGKEEMMEPYYTIIRLPGEKKEEFILILPFTPARKDNMIAWLAARSDGEHYGKLIVYNFPKAKLVYGPRQIGARIDQEAEISKQLSLWSQRGSRVIMGSLLAIPIEKSLLYIQPLYLAAERGSQLPELKRVIVAFGNSIAMEENLELSLSRIFGGKLAVVPPEGTKLPPKAEEITISALAKSALDHFNRAHEYLRQGNWSGYGDELKRMEEVLKSLRDKK